MTGIDDGQTSAAKAQPRASFFVRHTLKFIGAVAQATDFGVTAVSEPEDPLAADLFRPRTLKNMKLFSRSIAEL